MCLCRLLRATVRSGGLWSGVGAPARALAMLGGPGVDLVGSWEPHTPIACSRAVAAPSRFSAHRFQFLLLLSRRALHACNDSWSCQMSPAYGSFRSVNRSFPPIAHMDRTCHAYGWSWAPCSSTQRVSRQAATCKPQRLRSTRQSGAEKFLPTTWVAGAQTDGNHVDDMMSLTWLLSPARTLWLAMIVRA